MKDDWKRIFAPYQPQLAVVVALVEVAVSVVAGGSVVVVSVESAAAG